MRFSRIFVIQIWPPTFFIPTFFMFTKHSNRIMFSSTLVLSYKCNLILQSRSQDRHVDTESAEMARRPPLTTFRGPFASPFNFCCRKRSVRDQTAQLSLLGTALPRDWAVFEARIARSLSDLCGVPLYRRSFVQASLSTASLNTGAA